MKGKKQSISKIFFIFLTSVIFLILYFILRSYLGHQILIRTVLSFILSVITASFSTLILVCFPKPPSIRIVKILPFLILGAGIILYGAFGIVYHYFHLGTVSADYGIFDQWIWKLAHFKEPYSTIYPDLRHPLWDHFQPIIYLLIPFYWFFDTSFTLYFLEILSVCFGALAVYLLAREELENPWLSSVFAFSYLFFVGNQQALAYTFHPTTFISPLLLFAFYFYRQKKYFWHFVFILLLLLCKESAGLYLAAFGIFLISKKKLLGFVHLFLGLFAFWFVLIIFPSLIGAPQFLGHWWYQPLGSTPMEGLRTIIFKPFYSFSLLFNYPDKIALIVREFGGFGLILPFLAPRFLILAFPFLAERLWSSYPSMWQPIAHWSGPISAVLVLAALYGFIFIKNKVRDHVLISFIALVLLFNLILMTWLLQAPLHNFGHREFYSSLDNIKATREALALIPKNVPVSAQDQIVPHLGHREKIYLFPAINDADFILLNEATSTWPSSREEFNANLTKLLSDSSWKVKLAKDGVYVFKRR